MDLASAGLLDLSSKPEMSVEELENLTVLLLSLNPRKYRYLHNQFKKYNYELSLDFEFNFDSKDERVELG